MAPSPLSPQATLSPGVKVHPLNPAATPFIVGPTKKQRQLNLPSAPHKGGLTQPKGWGGCRGGRGEPGGVWWGTP